MLSTLWGWITVPFNYVIEFAKIAMTLQEIKMTQSEFLTKLNEFGVQLTKVAGEISAAKIKIDELVAMQDQVPPAVASKFLELQTILTNADDTFPDVPTPPTE